jgi:hypothetical protein
MAALTKGGGMSATRERGGARLRALAMVWTLIVPPLWGFVWAHAKLQFAMLTPVVAPILLIVTAADIAAPHASSGPLALGLQAGGSILALAAWTKFIAIPFVTTGKLPNGRYLGDVVAPRRRERDRRKALRQRRHQPGYRPHAHRRQTTQPPGEDS